MRSEVVSGLRVIRNHNGTCTASLVRDDGTEAVGHESSLASLERGEDPVADAIASLRRVYDRLRPNVPVTVYRQDGTTVERTFTA